MLAVARSSWTAPFRNLSGARLFQLANYSSQRLTVADVLKQTSQLRIGKSELKSLEDGLYADELPPAKRGSPQVGDFEKLFSRTSGTGVYGDKKAKRDKELHASGKGEAKWPKLRRFKQRENSEKQIKVKKLFEPDQLSLNQVKPLEVERIPKLAHNLDRVLFSPGVQFLQDPRTRIYNYDPHLSEIISIDDFNFDMVQGFVTVSKDKVLLEEAIKHGKQFYSSTLSMTLTLQQLYFFLNDYNPDSKSRFDFPPFSRACTTLPLSMIVEPKGVNPTNNETIYSVSSDKSTDVEILLGAMGHCLEVVLTHSSSQVRKYLLNDKQESSMETSEESALADVEDDKLSGKSQDHDTTQNANVYNYLTCGDFLMRSQLDCYDPRLPGNGTFDLKSRAVCAIRHDHASDASKSTYQIWKLKGQFESFEREFNDLIRTGALLKYGFQARIGQMDGIFIAYHNVNSFFGFQYMPLLEIDLVFYSDRQVQRRLEDSAEHPEKEDNLPTVVAESQFKVSLSIWQDIMKTVIGDFKGTQFEGSPFRLVLKHRQTFVGRPRHPTSKNTASSLQVFAVPMDPETVEKLQHFSDSFETSFRANITNEQRLENLQKYQKELNNFNSELVKKLPVFRYNVNVSVNIDGTEVSGRGRHPYPPSTTSRCVYNYTINADQTGDKPDNVPISGRKNPRRHPRNSPALSNESQTDDVSTNLNLAKHHYLSLMKSMSNMLTMTLSSASRYPSARPSLVDQMRRYSAVGKRRTTHWHLKQHPARRYHPHL